MFNENLFFKGIAYVILASLPFFFSSSLAGYYQPPYYTDPEKNREHYIAVGVALATALVFVGWATYTSILAGESCPCTCSGKHKKKNNKRRNNGVLNLLDDPNTRPVNNNSIVVTSTFPASYYDNEYFDVLEDQHYVQANGINEFDDVNEGFSTPFTNDEEVAVAGVRTTIRKESLSGSIVTESSSANGSFSLFVQLPDGTTQSIGNISLKNNSGSTLSFGPFNQKGTYCFGAILDQGSFNRPSKIATVNIHIDDSLKESLNLEVTKNCTSTSVYRNFHFM